MSFFWTGLNEQVKQLVHLSLYGRRGKSMDFVELVLTKSGSSFTVGEVREEFTSHSTIHANHVLRAHSAPYTHHGHRARAH